MRTLGRLCLTFALLSSIAAVPVYAAQTSATITPTAHTPGSLVRFLHLSQEDGLSQNAGLALLQDSRGFVWIGTQDGLDRYDGHTFTVYKNDPDNPQSLSHNAVYALLEDTAGQIWIGTWGGGLNRFDPRTQQFTRFQNDPNNPNSLGNDSVTSLLQDAAGTIWVGTLGGLDRFDPHTNGFTHYRNDPNDPASLSSDAVSKIFEDSRGALWIGTGGFSVPGAGLNQLDRATGKFTRYTPDPTNDKSIGGNNVSAIVEAPDGALWIGLGGFSVEGAGLDRLDPQMGIFTHFRHAEAAPDSVSADNVMAVLTDDAGTLWASTFGGGLNRMAFAAPGHFVHYRHDPYFAESLSGDEAWGLLQDRSGMLWIGTARNGINQLPANSGQFNLYRHIPNNPDSLANDAAGAFAEDAQGRIWIATWGSGLDRFDPTTGRFDHVMAKPDDPASLSNNTVLAVHVDAQGLVWAATLGGGLNRYDPVSGAVKRYQHDAANPQSTISDSQVAIFPDGTAGLWIGTFEGLDYFDFKTETFTHYLNDPANPRSLSANQAVSAFIDRDNQLWVGTYGGGLNRLDLNNPANRDPAQAQFTIYHHDPKNPESLSSDGIFAMHQTSDGTLWFGTQSGLNRFDPQTQKFHAYYEKQGLPNNTVLGILEDAAGYLWITTNNGLAKFDPRAELFTVYTAADGLQSNEFNSNGAFSSRAGTMYIGGVHGFNLFRPEEVLPNPIPPPVAVTRFAVYNQPQDVDLSGQTPIKLSYDQDFISFDFAALDFNKPEKNQFAYKLEGFDQDWIEAGTRPYASYTNLPGGQYTFQVKAANGDGVWNAAGASLPIEITPPFWDTWGFRIAVLSLLVLGVAAAFYSRTRSIRQQNTRLQAMVDEQKRVEIELRQSEARFKAIFENSAVGMGLMSMDRIVLDSNPAMSAMLGYTREELIGQSPALVTYPEDFPTSTESFQQLLSGEATHYIAERRYVRKNGEVFWTQISMSMVRDPQGNPLYLVGLINDIDAQKRAAEKLAAQDAEHRQQLEQRIAERTAELNQANELLREKAAQDAVVADRTRLARDLHDAVTQTLFSASLIAEVLPELWEKNQAEARRRLEELRQLTRGALAEMRTLLVELRPNALIDVPLPVLLKQLGESFIGRARLPVQLNVEGKRALPADVQMAFYRITQEALNNIVKHAKATQVIVTLRLEEVVRLSIVDNGVGFDPASVPPNHLGTKIMRERAEAIGAKYSLYSEPGEGTQISITWDDPQSRAGVQPPAASSARAPGEAEEGVNK